MYTALHMESSVINCIGLHLRQFISINLTNISLCKYFEVLSLKFEGNFGGKLHLNQFLLNFLIRDTSQLFWMDFSRGFQIYAQFFPCTSRFQDIYIFPFNYLYDIYKLAQAQWLNCV